jgi:predicted phage terminase large subunit-like protein
MRDRDELLRGISRIATPACFAVTASRGRWRLAPHLEAIDRAVLETIRGITAPVLVIEAPPRHGKSELISHYLPAWYLGTFPDARVMLAAHGAGFARTWGRRARAVLEESGPQLFGIRVRSDLRSASEWGLVNREGGMVAAGIGGPLTGRGADLLIIDDPVKNSAQAASETIREAHWDWWQSTASTRIEPGGCAVIIATRWHEDDLSGRLIAAAGNEGPPVRRLRLPALAEAGDPLGRAKGEALWPERWSVARLDARRREIDISWWLALYQQRPGRGSRIAWPDDYFGPEIMAAHWPESFEYSAVALDPAKGRRTGEGDFSAVVFVGLAGDRYWVDACLVREPVEQLVARALLLVDLWRPHAVAIESNGFQELVGREFDRQCAESGRTPPERVMLDNNENKQIRISRLGPYFMEKLLRFRMSPGVQMLVRQLRDFPQSKHDDGPDALEMALRTVVGHRLRRRSGLGIDLEIARAE